MNSLMTITTLRRRSVLHAPATHGARLDDPEDDVLDDQPDYDDGQQSREHVRDLELVLVLVDEPSQSAGPRRHTEHELCRDEGAPREGPAYFQSGQNAGERCGNQDADDI